MKKDESREALRKYREAVALAEYSDDEEVTRQSVIVIPGPPRLPTGTATPSRWTGLQSALLAIVTAISTGAAIALAKKWGK